jgi:hypothetical protein
MLAVGEKVGASGKNLLTTLVAGYEIAARLGMAFMPRPLAHQNGQAMLLAAAAAGARMHGLDGEGEFGDAHRRHFDVDAELHQHCCGRDGIERRAAWRACGAFAPELALAGFEA